MNKIVIVTDSAVDLNKEYRKEALISSYVHGIVNKPDGSQLYGDCDWNDFTPKQYFDELKKSKEMYKTASGTLNDTIEVFENELKQGHDILAISIGSAFSAVTNLFGSAKNFLVDKYPNNKIEVVDSMRYSGGYALLCFRASDLIKENRPIEEIGEILNKEKNCIHQIGVLDDLFFLNKSGRISKKIAVMGTMVGVRPIADFYPNGFASVLGNVKGEKKALGVACEYINRMIRDKKYIVVANSNRENEANYYCNLIKENIKPEKLIATSVGQVSGANVGPGLVAAFFFGDEVTADSSNEKKVFEEITNK